MIEVARSNDPVRLSWLKALLAGAGIESVVWDEHASAAQGSTLAIVRRLMVAEEAGARALRVLAEAGESEAGGHGRGHRRG